MSSRLKRYADLLVGYSIFAKSGEEVLINSTIAAFPLIVELYRAILERGALSLIHI